MSTPKILKLLLFFLVFFLSTKSSQAWDGFDFESNVAIEIPEGNMVREGLFVEFYHNNQLHNGKVLKMQSAANGLELTIEDLTDKQERVFIMK